MMVGQKIIYIFVVGRGVDDKRRREEDVSDGLVEGENNDLKRHKVELSASVAELLEAERHHTTTVMAASPSEPVSTSIVNILCISSPMVGGSIMVIAKDVNMLSSRHCFILFRRLKLT